MNRPPENFVRIDAEALRAFAAACFDGVGMVPDHARQLAQLLVDSDLRGVRSHGSTAIGGYSRQLRDGRLNARPDIRVVKETDVAVQLDGDGSLGYAPMMMATELAIEKARAKGVGVGAVFGIGHYGCAGHYVRRAMGEGCTAFSVQGRHPQYYESNEGVRAMYYGNPPISFGLPSEDEPPVVLDAATCILADYQRGPEYDALETLIPAALFKSMGYGAVANALGGGFVGQGSERSREIADRWPGASFGGLVWVMDIGLFTAPDMFRDSVDTMVRMAREQLVPMQGYDEATLPGAVEDRLEREYRRDGIKFAVEDEAALRDVAAELGVPLTWDRAR